MQIWKKYYKGEINEALFKLSKDKFHPAIVVTTNDGQIIPAEKYDAAASHGKGGEIHAFLRIGKVYCGDEGLYYDLEHTQLYPEEIKEIAVCERFVSESESPEIALKPGMKVFVTRNDLDETYKGELTVVTFLDVVIKTAETEKSVPVSKIRTLVIEGQI